MNWSKVDKYGGMVFLCVLFGYIIYEAYSQTYELAYKARYTIGKITELSRSGHLVRKVDYKYYVNGVEYERRENYQGGKLERNTLLNFLRRHQPIVTCCRMCLCLTV